MTTLVIGSGIPVDVTLGDTLHVEISLLYTLEVSVTATLWCSLYIAPVRDYTIMVGIDLPAGTNKTWTGTVDMPITEASGLRNYTYHLLVELPDYGLSVQEDNAVTCSGMPEGVWQEFGAIGDMIMMLVVVMMMSMMMNIMQEPGGVAVGARKEYEKVKEKVQPVVQIFTGDKD